MYWQNGSVVMEDGRRIDPKSPAWQEVHARVKQGGEEIFPEDVYFAWDRLRAERNRRLAECDWAMTPDAPTDKAAWEAYRQALRELPGMTDDPMAVQWPTSPAA